MMHFNQKPQVATRSLATSAMLVDLHISQWSGNVLDKAASMEVDALKGAKAGTARVHKSLLKNCASFTAIGQFVSQTRTHTFYRWTVPWSDQGPRLLPTQWYDKFVHDMTAAEQTFWELVDTLIDQDYRPARQAMQFEMGSLWDPTEYPTEEELRRKFRWTLNYMPVPEKGDFRVDVGVEATERVKSKYEEFYEQKLREGSQHVQAQLQQEANRLINQLRTEEVDGKTKKGRVFQGTIDHARRLTDMIGDVNWTNDPTVQLAQARLREALDGFNAEDLRKDLELRSEVKVGIEEALKALPTLDI